MTRNGTKRPFGSLRKSLAGVAGLVLAGALQVSADVTAAAGDDQIREAAEQVIRINPVLTAFENVEVPLLLLRLSRAARTQKVVTALTAVDLTDRAHHLPRQLSGGQQQRVAIARAIVADPVVVLADEPTGNLDRVAATMTMVLLRRLVDEFGKTLVMVTHDLLAAEAADRVVHLDKGRIVPEASHA